MLLVSVYSSPPLKQLSIINKNHLILSKEYQGFHIYVIRPKNIPTVNVTVNIFLLQKRKKEDGKTPTHLREIRSLPSRRGKQCTLVSSPVISFKQAFSFSSVQMLFLNFPPKFFFINKYKMFLFYLLRQYQPG